MNYMWKKMDEATMAEMESVNADDILHDCRPFLVVYKDGRVKRFGNDKEVPPSFDSATGVNSKDVVIDGENGLYVRLYKPQGVTKTGVIVYFHGGGFCRNSAASGRYHSYLNTLSFRSNMIIVSVEYRKTPENPLPIGYEDSWAGLTWFLSGTHGEPWLNEHADLSTLFLAGDSAGANIAHLMAKKLGDPDEALHRSVTGILLVHPFFWGVDRIGNEPQRSIGFSSLAERVWIMSYPGSSGLDDPLINPGKDTKLSKLATDKVLVCVAEYDLLRDRGFYYKEVLLKSGWQGSADVVETLGQNHVFHLNYQDSPEAADLMNRVVTFLTT